MSTESSASETTPLRRPVNERAVVPSLDSGITNNNNIVYDSQVRLHHSSNSNNNSIVIQTLPHQLQQQQPEHNEHQPTQQQNDKIMDTNKRILCRVGIDVFILLCVGFPILLFHLLGDPYKRGFFCDDESLRHPFKDSTVRNWMLYFIGLVIPVSVILAVELIISQRNAKHSNGNDTSRRYTFMGYKIPDWLLECYKKIGIFGFGAAASQLTTDIAKYSIGRLRPHFIAVCQPILADGSTCDMPQNVGRYIQDFSCQGVGSTARMLKEMRLSFPSGHSSFTFYTMVYVALYLQARMTWHGSKLLRHFLQFLFIMIAWYTALSRVSDYKHHWSDVLAGSTIGALTAIIVANYISDLFHKPPTKPFLPQTTHDTTLQSTNVMTN